MSTKIRDVLVKITADNSGLEKGLDAARSTLRGFAVAAGAALGSATVAFGGVAAAAIQSSKEIDRFAKVSNSSTTQFQRWSSAAKTAGIETEKMADILKDVNDRVGDFMSTGGGPMKDFFENIAPRVGVTAEAFKDLSGPDALQLFVSTLERAGASQQQMTFYMEAMAGDATLLLPLLRDNGAELNRLADAAQRAGAILSEETLSSLREARMSVDEINSSFQGFTNQLIAAVAPALATAAASFAAMSAQGGPVSEAVASLATAFSSLATVLSSPEFIASATQVFSSILQGVSLAASGFVLLAENIELVTVAVGVLATAVAVLGGPLSLAVKLGLLAGSAYLLMGQNSSAAETGAYNVAEAEAALNAQLNIFSQSASPAARNESRQRVISLKEQAQAALSAAEAELALASAMAETAAAKSDLSGQDLLEASAGAGGGMGDFLDGVLPDEKAAKAAARIESITAQIKEMTSALKDMDASGGSGGSVQVVPLPEIPGMEPFTRPDESKGGGGSGGGEDSLSSRLEALQEELSTEKELLDEWYVDRQATLEEALANREITEEEYRQQRERLEKEHVNRMSAIDKASMDSKLSVMKHIFGGLEVLMDTGNKKLFNIGKAAALANAAIEGYEAAISSFKHGAKIGGPALGAVYAGISLIRTAAMMAKIASQRYGGGGSSAGVGSSGSTATASQPAPEGPLQVQLNTYGSGDLIKASDFGAILDGIREVAGDRGVQLTWRTT